MHTYVFHVSVQLRINPELSERIGLLQEFLLTALHRLKNGTGSYGMAGSSHPYFVSS